MILLVTSLLLFFAWLCHYFKKSRSAATLAVLAGAVLLGAASGLIARPMAASLQRPYLADPGYGWSQNNVIVLLGAGTEPLPELSAARVPGPTKPT